MIWLQLPADSRGGQTLVANRVVKAFGLSVVSGYGFRVEDEIGFRVEGFDSRVRVWV